MSAYCRWRSIACVSAVFAAFTLAGCGGDKGGEKTSGGGGSGGSKVTEGGGSKSTPAGEKTAIEGKGTATLKGKVTYGGATVPTRKDLKPEMEKQGDKSHCVKGDTLSQDWIVGPDKGVEYAVVFLKAPSTKYFKVPDELRHRTDTVVIDQPFCAFQPHVVAINPSSWDAQTKKQVKTGQVFKIQNSAPINHNTAWHGNSILNPGKNESIPAKKGDEIQFRLIETRPSRETETGKEDIIAIGCDIHKWMSGRAVVLDHPYYAVTDKDGNYEIKNAPADAELEVVVWHESMGDSTNKGHKETITLKPGENTKNFEVGK